MGGPFRSSRRTKWLAALAGGLVVAVAGAGGWAWRAGSTEAVPAHDERSATPARRETRPTLDPARFVGKAARAHQVARAIPDTLDQLYCYCHCDKSIGHKSLLSCYTDGHAAT